MTGDTSVQLLAGIVLSVCSLAAGQGLGISCMQPASSNESIYQFSQWDILHQRQIGLSSYQGKVVLISNVATY